MKKIVLLPGHASTDGGSVVCAGAFKGKSEFQLAGAYYLPALADALRSYGYEVVITTRDVAGGSTPSYSAIAANSTGADIALEFHFNSFSNPSTGGTEVLHYGYSSTSKKFATILSEKLAYILGVRDRGALPAYNKNDYLSRKAKERCTNNGFSAFQKTVMPYFMIEPVFAGSNPAEAERFAHLINSGTWATQAAAAIHSSISIIYP